MRLYSWKDVERLLFQKDKREIWEKFFKQVEVYPEELYYVLGEKANNEAVEKVFEQIFGKYYKQGFIKLDISNKKIKVLPDDNMTNDHNNVYSGEEREDYAPLFKNIAFQKVGEGNLKELSVPIIAFHSYKGGVGRTLSMMAFAKAWSEKLCVNRESGKLLIVDADIEAPGLTWLLRDSLPKDCYSYLDLLDMIQDNDNVHEIIDEVCKFVEQNTIKISTETKIIEHYFLPVNRYRKQLLDLYATPETIVRRKVKNYVIDDVLSGLAQRLNAQAVIIDLRAGFSEYSAPILFDDRVYKYIVTTTSLQATMGTKELLGYMLLNRNFERHSKCKVILNMIPLDGVEEREIEEIRLVLMEQFLRDNLNDDCETSGDNSILPVKFVSELIHLTDFKSIMQKLSGRDMYNSMLNEVQEYFGGLIRKNNNDIDEKSRREFLIKLSHEADCRMFAETNDCGKMELLSINPINRLIGDYKANIPTTVILGSKGVGKTSLYVKMVCSKDWRIFCNAFNKNEIACGEVFLPVLASKAIQKIDEELKVCIENCARTISLDGISNSCYIDNAKRLVDFKLNKHSANEWADFWFDIIVSSAGGAFSRIEELDDYLQEINKKIIVIFDGLEDYIQLDDNIDNERIGIQTLCQDVVNYITAKCINIGIIVFMRKDMAVGAIDTNFAQFEAQYKNYELLWSYDEAIRLAYWLMLKAKEQSDDNRVEEMVVSEIVRRLIPFWGLKLGKDSSNEAYTARWVLAALSDFNGQLSARDMIRFLKYAAEGSLEKKITDKYTDRYIVGKAIREAVKKCSKEKIDEVMQEYKSLEKVFEKLKNLSERERKIPILEECLKLDILEIKAMEQAGFLKKDNNLYYLPEIIRDGLEFKSDRARPKVLSLMKLSFDVDISGTVIVSN